MWTKIKGHIFVETKNKIENYIFEVAKNKKKKCTKSKAKKLRILKKKNI